MDFSDIFKYGPDYLERTKETTCNPFWLGVVNGVQLLQNSYCFKDKEVIQTTLLWYNNMFQLQINRQWHDEGLLVIGDLLPKFYQRTL